MMVTPLPLPMQGFLNTDLESTPVLKDLPHLKNLVLS